MKHINDRRYVLVVDIWCRHGNHFTHRFDTPIRFPLLNFADNILVTTVYAFGRIRAGTLAATILFGRSCSIGVAASISSEPKHGRGLNGLYANGLAAFDRQVAQSLCPQLDRGSELDNSHVVHGAAQ